MSRMRAGAQTASFPVNRARRARWLGRLCQGLLIAVLALASVPAPGFADDHEHSKTASGLTIYLGLVPAQIVRGHLGRHAEAQAHGGPPRGEHVYHLIVAAFDATSGARIEDANVTARVSSLGLAGPQRALEPMKIAETVTYGNYFNLPGRGRYRINVAVERPQGIVTFEFAYDH